MVESFVLGIGKGLVRTLFKAALFSNEYFLKGAMAFGGVTRSDEQVDYVKVQKTLRNLRDERHMTAYIDGPKTGKRKIKSNSRILQSIVQDHFSRKSVLTPEDFFTVGDHTIYKWKELEGHYITLNAYEGDESKGVKDNKPFNTLRIEYLIRNLKFEYEPSNDKDNGVEN